MLNLAAYTDGWLHLLPMSTFLPKGCASPATVEYQGTPVEKLSQIGGELALMAARHDSLSLDRTSAGV